MKKIIAVLLLLTLAIGVMSASAAEMGCRRRFADVNGDGVCDAMNTDACGRNSHSQNGCGRFASMADGTIACTGNADCPNFTDVDQDGVCDNAALHQGQHNGMHRSGMNRHHQMNRENSVNSGKGMHHNEGHGRSGR